MIKHKQVHSIKIPKKLSTYHNDTGKPLDFIEKLSTINIFVGANNSGKSRFLRGIVGEKDLHFFPNIDDVDRAFFLDQVKSLNDGLKELINRHPDIVKFSTSGNRVVDLSELNMEHRILGFFNSSSSDQQLKQSLQLLDDCMSGELRPQTTRGRADIRAFGEELKAHLRKKQGEIAFLKQYLDLTPAGSKKRFYIPVLRGLHSFSNYLRDENEDIFEKRIRAKYLNEAGLADLEVFTGQQLYETTKNLLLGSHQDRKQISDYEKYLSKTFFNGQEVALVPNAKDDVLHVKIGSEENPIYELGDGIQTMIVLTFPIFVQKTPSLFFIEEPEQNLHPGMQRKLMQAMQENDQHQYFITTHSNHILDLTLDYDNIAIFTFRSKAENPKEKIVTQVSDGSNDILEVLGAQNSSVFLANATVWVEGITDRLYIQKFLDLFQNTFPDKKRINQDIDYSFVEYGGSNITHWSFLEDSENATINVQRLCGSMILIADQDGEKAKLKRKALLKKNLGDCYVELNCREIENILSLNTLEKVVSHYEKDFLPVKFKTDWPHQHQKIGNFLEKKLLKNTVSRRSYSAPSGTIKNKVRFCKLAIEKIQKFDDLTEEAKRITTLVYDFVISQKRL